MSKNLATFACPNELHFGLFWFQAIDCVSVALECLFSHGNLTFFSVESYIIVFTNIEHFLHCLLM